MLPTAAIASETTIRTAHENDVAALMPLIAALGYPTAEPVLQQRLQALRDAGNQVLVATHDGQVQGLVVLHRTYFLHRPPDGRIVTLVVAEAARNLGLGSQLVAAAEVVFREWGCGRVEVSSGAARVDAHRFYQWAGYTEQPKRFIKELTA